MKKGSGMDWLNDAQRDFVGDEAAELRGRAEGMRGLGLWPEAHAMRFKLRDGRAAWLRVTPEERLVCLALAPWDDWWQCDCVAEVALFGGGAWPDTWERKARARKPAVLRLDWSCGWAIGLLPDKHSVRLCKALRWDGETLLSVRTDEEGPEMPVGSHTALRWWPYDRFQIGVAAMWSEGRTMFHNYRLFAMQAARAEKKRLKPSKD